MEVNSSSQSARDRYMRLTNGIFLNEIMRVIDPNPKVERLYGSEREDHMLRVQNFSILNRHIRAFYQEDLQQLILMPLPNVAILGQDPLTEAAVEELRRLLLLLLGCAVQCEEKETFIQQIQSLDIETQAAIASYIQQVTQDPRMVLPLRWEELVEFEGADLQLVFSSMAKQIQSLLAQRDTHLERMAELCREREVQSDSTTAPLGGRSEEPPQGLVLQLADSKAKLREDKGDQILDYNMEIQTMEEQLIKLQKETLSTFAVLHSPDLFTTFFNLIPTGLGEVRGMRALRDELDCARERAARAEQLQTELQSCKHRLHRLELTRTQLKEQQQLCAALQETKVLLEEQLADARARCSSLRELERDNLLLRQKIIDVEAERDIERQRVDELLEMNMSLEANLRHSSSGASDPALLHQRFFQSELDSDEELSELIDQRPLSVEVGEASTLMLLGAEQENAELRRRLEELQAQQEVRVQGFQGGLPDPKDEMACLETEHQGTLREFQNMKNENATLKQHLELLEAQEEAERQAMVAQDLRSNLGEQSRRSWEAEQRLVVLEAELQRLKRAAESLGDARRQIEVLQAEGLVMEEELCRLRSQVELHSMQTTVIATLEGERAALERDRDTLRSTTDALRTAHRKSDQFELTTQTLRAEVERQGRSLETSRRREEELEAELREATLEAESLARARDQALLEASRLEQEKEDLEKEISTRLSSMEESKQQLQEQYADAQAKISSLWKREEEVRKWKLRPIQIQTPLAKCTIVRLTPRRPHIWINPRQLAKRAVAVAGREALLSRLSESQETGEHLREQLEALRRHSLSLQDSCTSLQTLNTQLQVEQASLSSQHAAVLARCSESEARCAALEAESKVWAREREESVARMEALRRDHERMTALQQRQEVELEELLEKQSQLRSNTRSQEAQHRELEARYKELLDGKTKLEEREREIKMEREEMEAEAQRRLERERELARLKEDSERLQAQLKEGLASQAELLAQGSELRGELSASQLERTRLEGELSGLRGSNQSLDLSNARLTSQYQLLTQLKGNMEEENRQLAEQNQGLLKENRALMEQSLERREQHYSQQTEYQEKLSELRREKQKLVEKIMDQYRVLEPSMQPPSSKAKKSNWIADRMKKLIKPRGGGRDGRALFTAAGSVENLADSTEFTSDPHTPHPDPRSAPVSPSPLRKARSQTEQDISAPGTPSPRSGSGARRKLGSRHGWGLGLTRGGSGVSQSFSPGDHKAPPLLRVRSDHSSSSVLWEGQGGEKNTDAPLNSQESVEADEGRGEVEKVD
ncbi:Protein Daple [Dissostichus eleginoides]|uniref:Protein Daple n=1 Tax=Dissostichus eleginoides TaxID=100907 RepID=A0AAD9FJ01_DISEL|nr:Protein Daple [Dissostichus eleginoides]